MTVMSLIIWHLAPVPDEYCILPGHNAVITEAKTHAATILCFYFGINLASKLPAFQKRFYLSGRK